MDLKKLTRSLNKHYSKIIKKKNYMNEIYAHLRKDESDHTLLVKQQRGMQNKKVSREDTRAISWTICSGRGGTKVSDFLRGSNFDAKKIIVLLLLMCVRVTHSWEIVHTTFIDTEWKMGQEESKYKNAHTGSPRTHANGKQIIKHTHLILKKWGG